MAGIGYEDGMVRRCTPNQLKAISLYFQGNSQADISRELKVSQKTIGNWFKKNPSVIAEMQRIKEETMNQLHAYLNSIAMKAVRALEAVLDDPNTRPSEKIRASQSILEQLIRVDENLIQAAEIRQFKEKITAILSEFEASDMPETEEFSVIKSLREGVLDHAPIK